jgi:regulator of nucleoside diphosphate kinase
MSEHTIEVTETDALHLRELLDCLPAGHGTDRTTQERLRHELDRAQIVPAHEVGRRVVTIQSRVVVEDAETHESETYTLVHPEYADHEAGRLSVLAPIGTAILGYREGDLIEWEVPAGTRWIRIRKVLYQPEAAGHEHLKS